MSLKRCIEDLFSKNTDYKYPEQAINQAESLKSLSSDLYTDNIRFIYELIQNADDAQAINVTLTILDDKYLIIAHDGKSFDEKDLQGLCGVNNGTKKKDLNKTGYKGLGFKAVFGKSDCVIIYSNEEYFRFDSSYQIQWNKQWGTDNQQTWENENDRQFIYPWQINPIWTDEDEIPNLIRDFLSSQQIRIHVANIILLNNSEEIRIVIDQLKEQPYMFLFLRNISQMIFSTKSTDIISIDRHSTDDLKKVYFNQKIVSQWIIKRFELDVPNDVRENLNKDSNVPEKLRLIQKVEMFFAAKYKDSIIGEIEKLNDTESHLFSYLPTKIFEYKFPMLINANFLTNANREQIHTDSAWNQWLFDKICIKLFEWIEELVVNDKYHFQAYKLIPSKLNLVNNCLSERFDETFDWAINNCKFILNRNNQLLRVDEVIMDLTSLSKQTSFIDIHSMRQYMLENDNNHLQYAEHPFIDDDANLARIGVKLFKWSNAIQMFRSGIFMKTFSIEQNKRMIEFVYSLYTNGKAKSFIEQIPFLMDQNDRLQIIDNIYFPAETIGESGTSDSNESFVNKIIFNWLNEYSQKEIKKSLQIMGVDELTDLTFLLKTIIPKASTFITQGNAINTIKTLFMLFEKSLIGKKELNQLKELKLLTTRGTLIEAEKCFFSKIFQPRLLLEEFLSTTVDKFLSSDYLFSYQSNDIPQWYRFFTELGVCDQIQMIHYQNRLDISEAIKYGFNREYLSRSSPNGQRNADGYSGLKTITFLEYTKDNYEFAQFFWSYIVKNMNPSDFSQNTRVFWRSQYGTEISNADYIKWFVQHVNCLPTTLGNCQSSLNTIYSKEIISLCERYMPIVYISVGQNLTKWNSFFNFKIKLSSNDYFQLLDKIYKDEKNLENNQNIIQDIYSSLLNESIFWPLDEQKLIKTLSKKVYLLTENNQWKLTTDLFVYLDNDHQSKVLNELIPCLKLSLKNKKHSQLSELLELFNITQINMNYMSLEHNDSFYSEKFRNKLIEILPYMKKWLQNLNIQCEIIQSLDKLIQQDMDFIESNSLQLFFNGSFIQETNVYFDSIQQRFYVTKPWDSDTTLMDLPNKLCQFLKIQGFEDKLRFLLKAREEEIKKYFEKYSIEIPTDNDIITLERRPRAEIVTQSKSSNESESDEDGSSDSDDSKIQVNNAQGNTTYQDERNVIFIDNSVQLSNGNLTKTKRTELTASSNDLLNKMFDHLTLTDQTSLLSSSPIPITTSFNRNGVGGNVLLDTKTSLIGEKFVYEYLLNKYHHQLDSICINWINENGEMKLPYDIILTDNGIKHYIEVKATRSIKQHTFFMSIDQIKAILEHKNNYYIYCVYLKQEKLIILDNIQSRLNNKNKLVLLLAMNPKSLDQAISTDK